tara:strand:+ start:122 stop:379 length:258 start_codon:yes stop_codon:yes gene_type:complete
MNIYISITKTPTEPNMTYQTHITQLPEELQELISQHLHQLQLKEVGPELIAMVEEREWQYLEYLAFVGDPPEYDTDDEETEPEWA